MIRWNAPKTIHRARTPTLIQMEAVECGAACLGIILSYYDRIVPLSELRQKCGVSRDGSKASNILKVARNYGLIAEGLKKSLENLKTLDPPYIVFWNFNHFLVVEGFGKNGVYLNDPGTGPRKVSLQEFDEAYTGIVLVLEPGEEFQKGGKKRSMVSALASRLTNSRRALIFCLLTGLFLTFPRLMVPAFTQVFVDRILVENLQDWLRPMLLGMIMAAVVQGLLMRMQLRALRKLLIKLSVTMSGQFIWHLLRLPVGFYAQRFSGEISSRIQLNDKVAEVLSGRLATTVIDTMMMGFYALLMLTYDRLLTTITILFAVFNFVALQTLSRSRVDASISLAQEYGKVSGVAIGGIQAIETVKASGLESDLFTKFAGYYTKALNSQQKLGLQAQILTVLPTLLTALATASILVIGGFRVIDGSLSIGMLVAYLLLATSFLRPINNLINFGSTLQELEADLNRLDDVLQNPIDGINTVRSKEEPRSSNNGNVTNNHRSINSVNLVQVNQDSNQPELNNGHRVTENSSSYLTPISQSPNPPIPQSPNLSISPESFRLQGSIELRQLTFGYSSLETPLIENLNLTVKPGQRVALVGGSGSGKSTIAKLLCGLYPFWSGDILFDGISCTQIPRSVLANSLAMVEQDIFLFAGTIRDNLTLWDTTIPEADLVKACQDAAIHEAILLLPGGYDAQLGEGGQNLSGGQRQRLEIARALVKNPSILVLDEATSALDAETEQIVDRNLRRRGCSCIVVAHRLSTIRDCDEIIVLEQGKVVQRGTHEELREQEGAYLRLIGSN
ncbi:NHLP family bacteriocin export ABC transporter peptidase/permease/ATPase subunit [Hyella patelloides]|uniref:NHLP family bacteriocin export ABC transporter peptidase/permease/ATPase subunit n=1 Tax=Hyella patelloides TaxID=1982969 RepID=UPI00319E5440